MVFFLAGSYQMVLKLQLSFSTFVLSWYLYHYCVMQQLLSQFCILL